MPARLYAIPKGLSVHAVCKKNRVTGKETALRNCARVLARQGAFLNAMLSHQGSKTLSQKCLIPIDNHRTQKPQVFLQEFPAKSFAAHIPEPPCPAPADPMKFSGFCVSRQKIWEPALCRQGGCLFWGLAGDLRRATAYCPEPWKWGQGGNQAKK